jgi:mono/diheme cytochrome c family protein
MIPKHCRTEVSMKPIVPPCLILLALVTPAGSAEAPIDYNRDVRPILAKNCFACHGQDDGHRAAKLRLDRREPALASRKRGAAIVPHAPDKSLLIARVTAKDEDERMPPMQTGNALSAAQIATLQRWIAEGAPYAEHWAFVKPKRPSLPAVKDLAWPRNGIDAFILAQLEKHGLRPETEADRYTLLRRVSLDLRGLPPSPQEIDAFLRDRSPDAYEKAVDRLLQDPAYGERWARMWLDLARYADSAGYGSDPLRPNMWRYRDWVIDAFNRNLPYDRFTIEQLAGDLLPDVTLDQRIATAFHRNTMTNTEGGTDDEEFRVAAIKDRVDTTLQVWMGLTMGCAKCHSHKYDPITQQEYYRFYAFFNQTADNDQPDERPTVPAPTAQQREQNRRIDERIAEVKKQLTAPQLAAVRTLRWTPIPLESLVLLGELGKLEKSRPAVPQVPVMAELPAKQRRKTHLMIKGNFLNPGEEVEPGVPAAFHPLPQDGPRNRLAVAKWLFVNDNPLTARVAVNRYWAALFGVGLVETEEDFGTQGEMPSHPELLDWLATEYVRLGWDTKAFLKLLVTSATYRQASKVTPEKLAKDPRNRLLSRGPRFRLEAEMVRDQALALSGLLSRKRHGPSVYPPQPPGLWQAAFNGQRTWATSTGEDRYRRGLYTFWRRTVPYPSMATFDATSRETCTVRRIRTNTPLQAFVTLNDPVYVECAQALARRIVREGGSTAKERARFGLRLCLCRPPRAEQVQQVIELFRTEREHYRKDATAALALATDPLGPLPAGMDAAELAAWTVVANVLLNVDGVLTKN